MEQGAQPVTSPTTENTKQRRRDGPHEKASFEDLLATHTDTKMATTCKTTQKSFKSEII